MSGSSGHKPEEVDRDLRGPIRELREYARGRLNVDHQDVSPVAGLVEDDALRDALMFLADVYDPSAHEDLPPTFWETQLARSAIRQEGTETAAKAVRDGDPNRAAYLTGVPSYRSDVSGMHAIRSLGEWLVHSEKCKLIYVAALMGRGKTDMALLMLESVVAQYERARKVIEEDDSIDPSEVDLPVPEVAANFHFEPRGVSREIETTSLNSYPELVEWVESGEVEEVRWFIFDEASTSLTAQSGANSQRVAESVAPLVKKMRKNGVNMIVIGHDAGDIHPAIRELCDFVTKPTLKSADFYAGVSNREPQGHIFSVDGLPQTSWDFNTDDMAEWSWSEEEEEDDLLVPVEEVEETVRDELKIYRDGRIRDLYERTDMSQAEVGELFGGLSQGAVSNILKSADDSAETRVSLS